MRDKMNISVNGQSRVPPGFRFHPTEEELLQYYLRKKVANDKIDLDFILEVDLNNLEPWDIQERCKIETTPQNDWYFFSHKDKKYPTGTRTNRATAAGFWKATGRDRIIYSNSTRIGMRKTLVFYKGRAPHGLKSDWIMHEYRLLDDDSPNHNNDTHVTSVRSGDYIQEGWVVCRIFKKRNHLPKALDNNPINKSNMAWETNSSSIINSSSDDHDHLEDDHDDYQGALEQIYQCMGGKPLNNFNNNNIDKKLSCLENPNSSTNFLVSSYYQTIPENDVVSMAKAESPDLNSDAGPSGLGDWATIDKLVASHLNGQTTEEDTMAPIFSLLSTDHHHHYHHHEHDIDLDMDQLPPLRSSSSSDKIYHPNGGTTLDHYSGTTLDYHYGSSNDIDLWSFTTRSSSSSAASFGTDPLCHVSKSGIQRKN